MLSIILVRFFSAVSQNSAVVNSREKNSEGGSKKYGVGFKSFMLYDISRPPLEEQRGITSKEKGRVIQTNLWYPTPLSKGKKLSAKDYLLLKGVEVDNDVSNEQRELLARNIISKNYNTTVDTISRLFRSDYQFMGMLDAPFSPQKFPLIAMVHNDPIGFARLAEYLASHGFAVVNFPISGTHSKNFDWETVAGIETELQDLQFVVSEIVKMPVVDSTCIIPIGYSYGAMAALAFQLRSKNVKAMISLDGGIGSTWGGEMLFKLKDFNIGLLNKPIFHAWSDLESSYDHKWLYNYICCEKYLMKFGKLRHGDFVEGVLFEKLYSGITSKVLGNSIKGNDVEFNILMEYVTNFALSIATGDKIYETPTFPITIIKKWKCVSS